MSILDELYNGNVVPAERFVKKGGEYARLMNELTECSEKLSAILDDTGKEMWNKIMDTDRAMEFISEKESFIDGFCLGARIMLEILNRDLTDRTVL